MKYLEWNDLLAKQYFHSSMSGREVLLYVNAEIIDNTGEPHNVGLSDFIENIKTGPPWGTGGALCNNAFTAYNKWRKRELIYPPYINYLVFFVLAGVTETGRAPHSYYPGIWKLLGEDERRGTPRHFDRMITLWDDLEKWSREDKHEELGRFVARIRGGWINVGLPRSQTILSENERKSLPAFFNYTGLDPTDPPTPEYLKIILSCYGQDYLENRTRKLIESTIADDIVLNKALFELVAEELENWDGTAHEQFSREQTLRQYTQTSLRLCIKLDTLASRANVFVRFKTGALFPDEPLQFQRDTGGEVWQCVESQLGWSTYFNDLSRNPPVKLDGACLDWENGERFTDENYQWRATLRKASVRVFRLRTDGLPDWIETQRLERGIGFLIACKPEYKDIIESWGNSCGSFEQKSVSGLSPGWLLFAGKNATKSCPGVGILTLSSTIRLYLDGGVKARQGNAYFRFAPPRIILENSHGTETVMLNGRPLGSSESEANIFLLPDDIPANIPLRIEVDTGEHRLSKVIRLEEYSLPDSFDHTPCRSPAGDIHLTEIPVSACGACVSGCENQESYKPPGLPALSAKIVLIGGRPGQICILSNSYNLPWDPVWAAVKKSKKSWQIIFCGKPHQLQRRSKLPPPSGDRASIKQWKKMVWHMRKRYCLPELAGVRSIWENFSRLAKNV